MTQRVTGIRLNWWKGILVIVGIMAILFAFGQLMGVMQTIITYNIASIATWVLGGIVALLVMRKFVLEYQYTMDGEVLQVDYMYGKKPRFLTQVLMRQVVMFDTVEAVRLKYPQAKITRAVKEAPAEKQMALCSAELDGAKILIFEPNEEMVQAIRDAIRAGKK